MQNKSIEITLEQCSWWLDPADNFCLAIPNDRDGNFLSMYDGEKVLPNAYPRHVWERVGWKFLDPVIRSRVADALTDLDAN